MTSQSPEKSDIGRRVFLRIPRARLVAVYAKVPRERQDRIRCISGRHAERGTSMASGFARHNGELGVGLGVASIRHKLSARRPDRAVHVSC